MFSDPIKTQIMNRACQKKNVRYQENKMLGKDLKTADNTIHGN